jgi:hypothetical protein
MSTKGKPRPTGKTVSEAEFRRLWGDLSLSVAQIGERLGICQQAVTSRAQRRGLPSRQARGGAKAMIPREAFFAAWQAGVSVAAMAEMFDCDIKTIRNTRHRMGLPKRPKGGKGTNPALSIAEYRAAQLREAMAASARVEQAAMRKMQQEGSYRRPGQDKRAA